MQIGVKIGFDIDWYIFTLPLTLYLYPDLKRHNQNTTRTPSPYLRKHVTLYMNHTLTNIEKEINSYLFPCPLQLRWKSHRPPSHRHTSYFIGSSLQVFLHRHTPCFIGSSLQASSLPSSASTITPPTSSATPESKSNFPSTIPSYRQLAFIGYQSIR